MQTLRVCVRPAGSRGNGKSARVAIYHLSVKTMSRSAGRSATAAAAYRAGIEITDARTSEVHDYSRRAGVVSSDLFLPGDAPAWASNRSALWNSVEQAETRKNSTIAREFVVALPSELSADERRGLLAEFCRELVEKHGIAVDASIHLPDAEGDSRNHHAHILTSTRRLGPDGFTEKARELDAKQTGPELIEHWRERWAVLSNLALARAGRLERIDHRSNRDQGLELAPTTHQGVYATSMDRRGVQAERVEETESVRRANAAKLVERPEHVFDKLTATQAVFTRRDIARELNRYVDDANQFQALVARLDASPELIRLNPSETDEARYSTREMIRVETTMADAAERMAGESAHRVSVKHVDAALAIRSSLSDEQKSAVRYITESIGLACVIGDAGTGKSFAMAAAREAWEASGYRVIGAALAGKAAEGLQDGSGIRSRTLASLELAWKKAKENSRKPSDGAHLDRKTVLVVDEAGMVGARQLSRVLEAAEKAGAKVVLVGDDKQLAAIEAGAPFRALVERNGAAEITEIRRQKEAWARQASQAFARGKDGVRTGLDAYRAHGGTHMVESRDAARIAAAEAWMRHRSSGSSIILAHTREEVRKLNEAVRAARRNAGELGDEVSFATNVGRKWFAAGDRIAFLRNDAALDVKNGTLGTVEAGRDGALIVRLDGDKSRIVEVSERSYSSIAHGYAVTIHKAQGVTVDRAYVLATGGMDRALTYVAMTRHREHAELFAGRDDFQSFHAMAQRIGRGQVKQSTLDFLGFAERRGDDRKSALEDLRARIMRAGERLTDIAERLQAALQRSKERLGFASDAPQLAAQFTQRPPLPERRRGAAEFAAQHAKAKAAQIAAAKSRSGDSLQTFEHSSAGSKATSLTLPGKAAKPADIRHQADEEALSRLLTNREAELRGRAERLATRLESQNETVSHAYREHQLARPQAPGGLATAFGGKTKHDQATALWQRKSQQIARRQLAIQRRLKVAANVARGRFDAPKLAAAKVKREHPALWKRIEAAREVQRGLTQRELREQTHKQIEQKLERNRGFTR